MEDTIRGILTILFHVYMIFIMGYSLAAIFALLRFGQSRIITFVTSAFYLSLISSLYFQIINLINKF